MHGWALLVLRSRRLVLHTAGLLAHESQWRKLVDQLPEIDLDGPGSSLRALVETAWASKTATPEQRWRQLKQTVKGALDASRERAGRGGGGGGRLKAADRVVLEKLIPSVVFTYCYPRLDVNVSKQRNRECIMLLWAQSVF